MMTNYCSRTQGRFLLALIIAIVIAGSSILTLYEQGAWSSPPEPGDGPDYDNIALNLSAGRGFGFFWDAPSWRASYERAPNADDYSGLLRRTGEFHPTAQRPPLYPTFLATLYSLCGRDFVVVRIAQVLLFSLAAFLLSASLSRERGLVAACIFALLAVRSPSIPLWSYYLYTESLSVLLLTAAFICLKKTQHEKTQSWSWLSGLGILLGLTVMTRHILVVFVPVVLIIGWRTLKKRDPSSATKHFLLALLFPLAITLLPWTARNYLTFGAPLPLGTQGGMNLAFDYSEHSLASKGLWTGRAAAPLYAEFDATSAAQELGASPVAREVLQNMWGNQRAIAWILKFPEESLRLVGDRLWSLLWNDALLYQRALLLLALLSLILARGRTDYLAWSFVLTNCAAVACTHSVPAGRFLVPVELLLAYLIGTHIGSFFPAPEKQLSPSSD